MDREYRRALIRLSIALAFGIAVGAIAIIYLWAHIHA